MKTLYIIRHAKSSWDDISLGDFERPLNDRGKRDAPRMGKRLKERKVIPQLMLSSPANRAFTTCKVISEVLNYPTQNIKTDKSLYHAGAEEILRIVNHLDDKFEIVCIFGHNPGLTDFANELRDDKKFFDNIPTCGVVAFECNVGSWEEMRFGCGKLIFYDYPKSKED